MIDMNKLMAMVNADCARHGMRILPPVTAEMQLEKDIEVAKRNYRSLSAKTKSRVTEDDAVDMQMNYAESVAKFYRNAKKVD